MVLAHKAGKGWNMPGKDTCILKLIKTEVSSIQIYESNRGENPCFVGPKIACLLHFLPSSIAFLTKDLNISHNKVKVSGKGKQVYKSGDFALPGISKLMLFNKKGENMVTILC